MNTGILALLFHNCFGVNIVSSNFVSYCDAFLFVRALYREVGAALFDLTAEQSAAVFAVQGGAIRTLTLFFNYGMYYLMVETHKILGYLSW